MAHNVQMYGDADREAFLACAAEHAPPGLVAEFGVWAGESLRMLAKLFPDRCVYGFDSFQGLPEDWRPPQFPKGHFACAPPTGLPAHVSLVEGLYEDTLPQWVAHHPPVAFAHIDCDLYSSTSTVLEHVRFAPGAVVVFDESWIRTEIGDELVAWLERGIPARVFAQTQKRLAMRLL